MKAYPSYLQEVHVPFIIVGAASCNLDTTCSAALTLTGKRHVTGSIFAASSLPLCSAYHGFCSSQRRNYCSFSSSGDGNFKEGVECYDNEEADTDSGSDGELLFQAQSDGEDGFEIQVTKLGKRSRRIESRIRINASLSTIWDVLTDYERLADFIPGLAESRLLEKNDNCARLFQIGQQNLALGLKFNAKAVLDCYEKELEILSFGRRRDIEFKMVEGDFETFEGKWSIEQYDAVRSEVGQAPDRLEGQENCTILTYVLEAEPKLWLPVRLVEGRLCSEIKTNLSCLRHEAQIRLPSSCS